MAKPDRDASPKGKPWKEYGRYGSIGIELVLSMLLGLFIGYRGDIKFGTKPWLTLLGIVVGSYAGFRQLMAASKKMERDLDRAEASERQRVDEDARIDSAIRALKADETAAKDETPKNGSEP